MGYTHGTGAIPPTRTNSMTTQTPVADALLALLAESEELDRQMRERLDRHSASMANGLNKLNAELNQDK